jgi:hypothetical protein
MELYIRIVDGQPFEHPILGDNFHQAFPNIDPNNLPESFAVFTRINAPTIGVYELYEGVTYEWSGGVVTDRHHVRKISDEAIITMQNAAKANWAENGYPSWVFDESICNFVPPVPRPADEKFYLWDEPTLSWVQMPTQP